jgi:hypothetical protein
MVGVGGVGWGGGLGFGVGGIRVGVLGMGMALLFILYHMMLCAAMLSYVVLWCAVLCYASGQAGRRAGG